MRKILICLCVQALTFAALADEAAIRNNIAERLPNFPKIDQVSKTPVPGLWEIRMGAEIMYSDEQGSYVIAGQIIDTKTRGNLTEARLDKLTAFKFEELPLQDAVVWKQGTGARKIVVFADPNCTYCKRFERDLNNVKNITVYTFLYPILGGDSPEKSRAIWCAKDKGRTWRNWMVEAVPPPAVTGACDTQALERNVVLGRKHGVNGTPSIVLESSERVPGVIDAAELEKKFLALRRKSAKS